MKKLIWKNAGRYLRLSTALRQPCLTRHVSHCKFKPEIGEPL